MNSISFKKTFFVLVALLLLWSCGSEHNDDIAIPDYVLNEEKFTKLLVDFALAEGTSNINVKNVSVDKIDSTYAFDPLKENNVSKIEYDSSLSFYSRHPALYKKIYENVLADLSKMQIKSDSAKVDSNLK